MKTLGLILMMLGGAANPPPATQPTQRPHRAVDSFLDGAAAAIDSSRERKFDTSRMQENSMTFSLASSV